MMTGNGIYKRVENELRTVSGLTIVNLAMIAIALCFVASFVILQALLALESGNVIIFIPVIIMAIVVAAVLGSRWILSNMSVLKSVADIRAEFHGTSTDRSGTWITSIIVQMLATYREEQPTIKRMTRFNQFGSIIFAILGVAQAIAFAQEGLGSGAMAIPLVTNIVGLIFFFGLAMACLVVFHSFNKYSAVWDRRLARTDMIEAELKGKLEEG